GAADAQTLRPLIVVRFCRPTISTAVLPVWIAARPLRPAEICQSVIGDPGCDLRADPCRRCAVHRATALGFDGRLGAPTANQPVALPPGEAARMLQDSRTGQTHAPHPHQLP